MSEQKECQVRIFPGRGFYAPEATLDALKALSASTGLTVAEHIRRAIDAYLRKAMK